MAQLNHPARSGAMLKPVVADLHPSAPIPVLGTAIGSTIRRRVGDSDLRVFPLALGASAFGWTAQADESEAILNRYVDFGGNLVDTADSYSAGRSEHIIGSWMQRRRNRDDMVIATKVGRHPDNPGLGPVSLVRAVEASLERLQTDYIDLLYFHEDDQSVPLEDSLGTAQWLIETGKVRYLAASGYAATRLVEARILAATGCPRFEAIALHYSLLHRNDYEGDVQLVARGQGLGVTPYSTLESGFLSGRYRSKGDLHGATRAQSIAKHLNRRDLRVLNAVDAVAAEQDAPAASVAVAWALAKHGITAPVVGASSAEQVDALIQGIAIQLTRSQMLELDRALR